MSTTKPTYKEIPLQYIEADSDQPRKNYSVTEHDRLLISIKKHGLLTPLEVLEDGKNHYTIIDGARRHNALQQLQFETAPCHVYSTKIPKWRLQHLRFEIQTVRKNWRPLEKANALQQIKAGGRFRSNRELAEFIGWPVSSVQAALSMRNQRIEYIEQMEHFKLDDAYRNEFLYLKPKLRKIRNMDVPQIVDSVFEKAHDGVIPRGKDFRRLKGIFRNAHLHEEPLHDFLKTPEMTIDELEARTKHSALIVEGEKFLKRLGEVLSKNITLGKEEYEFLSQFSDVLGKVMARRTTKQRAPVSHQKRFKPQPVHA